MSTLKINRVLALPEILEAHSLYIVKSNQSGIAELVFTTEQAEPLKVIDTAFVETMIAGVVTKASSIEVVNTITDRDALVLENDATVYVLDATEDPSINSGSALYLYKKDAEAYTLVSGTGTASVDFDWNNLTGRPTSTAAAIDNAVENSHTHANSEALNEIQDIEGVLHYKGLPISSSIIFAQSEW